MLQRYDAGRLERAERVAGGGVRVPAFIARPGLQTYRNADGSARVEYRPPDVVFSTDAMLSLRGAPVTRLHPGKVTGKNWRKVSIGFTSDKDPARETAADGTEFVKADLVIQHDDAIAEIESGGLVEVSAGYGVELDETPGVTPEGQRYDARQTRIVYNHVAVGPRNWARAGSKATLRLDGGEVAPELPESDHTPMKIKLDGIEYDVGSEAHVSALNAKIERADGRIAALTSDVATRDASIVTLTATATADKTRADSLETAEKTRASEAFRKDAATVLGADFKCDGKTDLDVKIAMVAKLAPKLTLTAEQRADGYLDPLIAGLRASAPAPKVPASKPRVDHNEGLAPVIAPVRPSLVAKLDAHYTAANTDEQNRKAKR